MTLENKLIFVDSNIILPSSSGSLYNLYLNKFREDSYHLTNNQDLKIATLKETVWDISFINKLLKDDNIKVTKGVIKQTEKMIENISDNIDKRRQSYIFSQLNQMIQSSKRDKDKRNYEILMDYQNILSEVSNDMNAKKYIRPQEETYFLISGMIREIKDKFDTVKENHKFDLGTDQEIVTSAIYESIINQKEVKVYSNDGDISNLIGTTYALLNLLKPCFKNVEKMQNFYKTPPKIINVDYPSLSENEVDAITDGNTILNKLGGYDGRIFNDLEKKDYLRDITSVGNFLDRIYPELLESLREN